MGAQGNLHSGHYGNYAPNPAQRLATLLASMKDDNGRVTIPGYYDRVKLGDAERKIMAAVPDDEAELQEAAGHRQARDGRRATSRRPCSIRPSIFAAWRRRGRRQGGNIIPEQGDGRARPAHHAGREPVLPRQADRGAYSRKGYHLVNGEPTDDERSPHDKLAALRSHTVGRAAFTPLNSAVGAWAQATMANTFSTAGKPAQPLRIRMMGGTVPTAKIVGALGPPLIIVPLVNPDNNQHSFDENLRVGHFLDGIRAFTGLLRAPFPG